MKKQVFFVLAALLLILSGCASDEVQIEKNLNSDEPVCGLRSVDEAVTLAKSMAAARGKASRSGGAVEVANVAAIGSKASRSGADTLLYAVNFADDAGYTLVSAAKYGVAVLGYTDEGSFDEEQAAENPNFSYFLDAAKDYANGGLYPGGGIIIDPIKPITSIVYVKPKLEVDYGQGYPEGKLFKNEVAGCVQTACLMVLSHTESVTSITYSAPNITKKSETLNWAELKKHKKSEPQNWMSIFHNDCEASTEIHDVLSRVCREIGQRNHADDTSNPFSTGATAEAALSTLKGLLPNSIFSALRNLNAPYTDLLLALKGTTSVAMVFGSGDTPNDAHCWVCDGGEGTETTSKAMNSSGELVERVERTYYNHFNWGWCGQDNGYFFAGVFDPSNPSSRSDYKNDVKFFTVSK